MSELTDMLEELGAGRDEFDPEYVGFDPRPVAVIIMELEDHQKRYAAWLNRGECEFLPGELVIPASNSNYRKSKRPHIVVESRSVPEPYFTGGNGVEPANGHRLDMRVAKTMRDNSIVLYWVQSFDFEIYAGPFE